MKLPDLRGWWTDRAVNKVRDDYKHSLRRYAKKHRHDRSSEDKFIVSGAVIYVAAVVFASTTGQSQVEFYGWMVFISMVFLPLVMNKLEEFVMAKKLTLTMMVVADNPEETRPIKLILRGVQFGAPMQSKEDLVNFLETKSAGAYRLIRSRVKDPLIIQKLQRRNRLGSAEQEASGNDIEEEAIRLLREAREQNMSIYPMESKGDSVPSLTMWPDDPEKCVRAREEKVRLSYGFTSVRHATIYALECKPIKTSIEVRERIVDVEYALFAPFFTQQDLDQWLRSASWFVPNRISQEIATYVKQQADLTQNESRFETLTRERDDAVKAYDRLVLHQQFTDVQKDVEGDVMEKYHYKRATTDYFFIVFVFIIGVLVGGMFLP